MSNRDTLVPTSVVNKNGVQTTVHKRAYGASKVSDALAVPVLSPRPDTASRESPEAAKARMVYEITDTVYEDFQGNPVYKELHETVSGYPDDVIAYIHKTLVEPPYRERSIFGHLLSEYIEEDKPVSAVNEVATYISQLRNVPNNHTLINKMLAGIREYDQLPQMDDYSKAEPRIQQQVTALLSSAQRLYEALFDGNAKDGWEGPHPIRFPIGTDAMVLGDSELTDLIVAQPENVDQIVDIMISGRTSVMERITKTLNHGASALDDGLL